ncbi:XRE family transcriptional regulator [Ornithinibacter aureus]|uniref:XRE family transcriptional regulator n=1 Tax=Ornithinibacter aureus TaxID=622664 RepID=A0ABP8JW39_9MICO|nr:XRE family transcriptional regulator [Ornithinibacter aureus]KAF0834507.1 Zn-dependent peptidase ImmA (M78 family) [Ornithinibacter aureus]
MTQLRGGVARTSDFDGTRLTVARRLRAMSKADLARAVDVTPTAVAQYEKGTRPAQAVLAQICLVLGMPREFFGAGAPLALLPASAAHFRSLRSTSSKAREQVLAYGELSLRLVDLLGEYVELPVVNLPDLELPRDLSIPVIEEAAMQVRSLWGVPTGPLPSVVQLLEAHGVIVLRLPEKADRRVDALSTWAGDRPLVFLNPGKGDRARSRFDAAHELGHLLLHPDTEPGSKVVEQQANAFAAELLMPRDEIVDQLPQRIDWPTFHELKRYWGVSLRALVYRAHRLGRLSNASYRRANQQLAQWGVPEPGSLGPSESPQLLGRAKVLLVDNGIDFDAVLAQGRLSVEMTHEVITAGTQDRLRVDVG